MADQLELGEGQQRYVPTQEALAGHLGANRKTVERWLKKPGCPGKSEHGYDVAAWDAWCRKNKLGKKKASGGKVDLENEKIRLHNERAEIINAKLRGEAMGIDEVCQTLGDMMAGFVLGLRQAVPMMSEEVVGVPLAEVHKRLRRRVDETLGELALGKWAQKKTFWSIVYARLQDQLETHGLGRGAKSMSTTSFETSGGHPTTLDLSAE